MEYSNKINIKELLEKYKIDIPIIQRDYAFGRKNEKEKLNKFLDEILESIFYSKNLHLDFIYGELKNNTFIPIDGQQRLTTLWLLELYLSKTNSNSKAYLDKFKYNVRKESREFCTKLIEEDIDYKLFSKSEYIKNESWFYYNWNQDPTILGMIEVLCLIHNKIEHKIEKFTNVKRTELDTKYITFSYLNVTDFGSSEDLYIKMNSRGKPLSKWDLLKLKIHNILNKEELTENLKWLDNHFPNFILNIYENEEIKLHDVEDRMYKVFQHISYFQKIDNNKNIPKEKAYKNVKIFVEYLKKLYKNDPNKKLYNEIIKCFKSILKSESRFVDIFMLYSQYEYALYLEDTNNRINLNEIADIYRITRNFSVKYMWQESIVNDFIKGYKRAIRNQNGIVDFFATKIKNNKFTFGSIANRQMYEEIVKSRLILNDRKQNKGKNKSWEYLFNKAEEHIYFRGSIGWLVKCSNVDKSQFKNYYYKVKSLFDENGIVEDKYVIFLKNLFKHKYVEINENRYIFPKNENESTGANILRDYSWRRYFQKSTYDTYNSISEDNESFWVKNFLDEFEENNIINYDLDSKIYLNRKKEMRFLSKNFNIIKYISGIQDRSEGGQIPALLVIKKDKVSFSAHKYEANLFSLKQTLKENPDLNFKIKPFDTYEEFNAAIKVGIVGNNSNGEICYDFKDGKYLYENNKYNKQSLIEKLKDITQKKLI